MSNKVNNNKYPALNFISLLLLIFGIVEIVFGVIGAVIIGTMAIKNETFVEFGIGFAVLLLLGSIFFGIILIAFSEIIDVFIDTEFNTRFSNSLMKFLVDRQTKQQQLQQNLKNAVEPSVIKREQPANPNATCPVCNSLVKITDYDCWNCNANFSAASEYKPTPLET